jgi:hypothetical protein
MVKGGVPFEVQTKFSNIIKTSFSTKGLGARKNFFF